MPIKISEFTLFTNVNGTNVIPLVDVTGPTNYKTTIANISNYILSGNAASATTAATATILATSRNINGTSFNGSADITITANTSNALTIGTGLSGTSFNGSSAVTIALASAYGDTTNPYGSKTANFILAAPNGTLGAPTFRAIVAADIPTLNQNTTGSAATLTTSRTISLTGDVTYTSGSFNGSENVTGTATLANSGATAGTYGSSTDIPQITVDVKGRITSVSSVAVSIPSGSLTFTGDVTGTGSTGSSTTLTLASAGTAGTYTKVTTDAKGRVTSGTTLAATDIPSLDASKITSGTIDAARLPSYVDDVIEGANLAAFPGTGETGKIYVALDTNKTYRWSGSAYIYITSGAVDSVGGYTGIVTATNLLDTIKTVDGTGSGLDADLLDGNNADAFYLATNPSGYTANTGTVTSVSGTGTVAGLSLSGTVTNSGNLTLGGTLSTPVSTINDSTTVGQNLVKLTNPSAVKFLRINADNTISSLSDSEFRTAIGAGTSSTNGTVTSVSVTSANGFAGSVATSSSTPAISITTSITGVLKGNGTAISAAAAGTDYQAPITLTTTGTSGAATFIGNVLNVPQYTGDGIAGGILYVYSRTATISTVVNIGNLAVSARSGTVNVTI